MNSIISLIKWKIRTIFSSNNHFSANVINSEIHPTSSICKYVRAYNARVGKYSYIARNTLIQNTVVESFCSISEGCNIGMPSHPADFVSTSPIFLKGNNYLKKNLSGIAYEDCPITYIGNDVWIGAHAQIKSGIRVGNGSIIGAGAVVTKDVPPYAIVGGIPARIIKYRFDVSICQKLNDSRWWELSDEELMKGSVYINNPTGFVEWLDSLSKKEIRL